MSVSDAAQSTVFILDLLSTNGPAPTYLHHKVSFFHVLEGVGAVVPRPGLDITSAGPNSKLTTVCAHERPLRPALPDPYRLWERDFYQVGAHHSHPVAARDDGVRRHSRLRPPWYSVLCFLWYPRVALGPSEAPLSTLNFGTQQGKTKTMHILGSTCSTRLSCRMHDASKRRTPCTGVPQPWCRWGEEGHESCICL